MYFFLSYISVSSWLVFMFASERVEKDFKRFADTMSPRRINEKSV